MVVAVDAMGGDFAPTEVVKGAYCVAQEDQNVQIVLVGDESAIERALSPLGESLSNITIRHVPETIDMGEHPTQAVRRKRNSSLVVSGLMVKSGEADGTMSAGNTGAAMVVATLDIGRIPGVERPAIATSLPTIEGRTLLLDAGANMDCTAKNLLQFARLGAVYAERVWGRENPSIGLLNVGSEPGKGNELTKTAFELLSASGLNFRGNVEGQGVFEHKADVVVCDGFVGNALLKGSEGLAKLIMMRLAEPSEEDQDRVGIDALLKRLSRRFDYAETGGAPLLGIDGVSVISHGRSRAKAIASAIRATRDAAASGMISAMRRAIRDEAS